MIVDVWNKPLPILFPSFDKDQMAKLFIDTAGMCALPSLKVITLNFNIKNEWRFFIVAPQSCEILQMFAPHHTNICKIQWFHRAISLLIFNKLYSNLSSLIILRHSFSCVDRSLLTDPNQKLKNTVELGSNTYYMNSSWNSWWYCVSLQLCFFFFYLVRPSSRPGPWCCCCPGWCTWFKWSW